MVESNWRLVYHGFNPSEEGVRESLCTLANGYIGLRGSAYESPASRIHYPGTYMAGGYNKLSTQIGGKKIYNEDLVNFPNCLPVTFKAENGEWFSPSRSKIIFYRQILDMHKGVLKRRVRFQNKAGHRFTVETTRIVSMHDRHLISFKYIITPENYSGFITVKTMLDGAVTNSGVERYRQLNSKHLVPVSVGDFDSNGAYLLMKSSQSKITFAQASRIRIFSSGKEKKLRIKSISKGRETIARIFDLYVEKGKSYEIEKTVSVCTSKDKNVKDPLSFAIDKLRGAPLFEVIYGQHIKVWDSLWKNFDIQIEADDFSQRVLRLHIFHLLQIASPHIVNIDAGLPARGLHGEAYRGHIFWDGVFAMAFYDLHMPGISKSILLYRYRRLNAARRAARQCGLKGAVYPWQSGSTGEEETQAIHLNPLSGEWGPDHSCNQRHVSLAIAYNIWQHYVRTEDINFIIHYGAEMFLSIARFFASLAEFSQKDKRYHIKGVMGPDEFHEKYPDSDKPGLKDNAYTNLMVVWLLLRAKDILGVLPVKEAKRIMRKAGLKESELKLWDDISRRMNVIINNEGIVAQFDGYFSLLELDWDRYRERYENIERLDRILKAEGKSPDSYKISKQADLLMLFYLLSCSEIKELFDRLGYKFEKDTLQKNYKYYIRRTSHGSTLSKVVHCYIADLLKQPKESWRWFQEVLESDIFDTQGGTVPEGIHLGVMGGSIDVVLRGFAGVDAFHDKIVINPSLPKRWHRIKFRINYKDTWISFAVTENQVAVYVQGRKYERFPVPFEINSKLHHISCAKLYRFEIKNRF